MNKDSSETTRETPKRQFDFIPLARTKAMLL